MKPAVLKVEKGLFTGNKENATHIFLHMSNAITVAKAEVEKFLSLNNLKREDFLGHSNYFEEIDDGEGYSFQALHWDTKKHLSVTAHYQAFADETGVKYHKDDLYIVTAAFSISGVKHDVETAILKNFESAKIFAESQKKEFRYQISNDGALNDDATFENYLNDLNNGTVYHYYTESKYGVSNLRITIKRAQIMDAPDSRVITIEQLQTVETLLSEVQKLNGLSNDNVDTAVLQVKTLLESLL
ncbi:hypothetical protein bcgnr5378_06550 [Bacillus cereus]|uniref:Uncharacterized protein n=1 Tax=Bacillus cereus TaxID=1396 RepID=A0A162NW22_BACCE|nr:hypothetical protein [Bacillus cereus]KZD55583.1 hypothetical protein B4088_5328 [Bacillus cereus]